MTLRLGARVAIALLALVPAGLSGCGQTGPLYLPEDDSATVITRPGPATPQSSIPSSSIPPAPADAVPGAVPATPTPTPTAKPPVRR